MEPKQRFLPLASKARKPMFRIKICGVTNVGDAQQVAEAGADAIGLNFCASSPRCITVQRAEEICLSLPPEISRVGVFVNAPLEQMLDWAERLQLDWLQLHGDEAPRCIAQLAPHRVLRAIREKESGFPHAIAYLEACREQNVLPAALLIDAYQAGEYGGTGKTANWTSVPDFKVLVSPLPVVLAGGLRPDNVADAIRIAQPVAVDTASGVEIEPGRKDSRLVRAFVQAAQTAFRQLICE
jgi:phosphoribosylanthranilate isomerase